MWLVFMATTLASDDPLPLLRNHCLRAAVPATGSAGGACARGRVHAAMKHDGTATGVWPARNSVGEHPTTLLKVRLKVPRLANPTSHATSVTGRSVWRSSVIARSTRRRWR